MDFFFYTVAVIVMVLILDRMKTWANRDSKD
jgi:hypothetical protein